MEVKKQPPFIQLAPELSLEWYKDWYLSHNGDPWRFENSPCDTRRKQAILDIAPKEKYDGILDLCCGEGMITRDIRKNFETKELIATDWLDLALEAARRKDPETDYRLLDIKFEKLDRKFDLVFFTATLNTFNDNLVNVIKNVKAMTGKYLVVWDRFTWENRADLLFLELLKLGGFKEIKTEYYEPWTICRAHTPSFISLFEVEK